MSLNYHNKGWRALIDRAGIVGLRWHDLRREATSRLFEDGLSVTEVAETSPSTVRIVQQEDPDMKQGIVALYKST